MDALQRRLVIRICIGAVVLLIVAFDICRDVAGDPLRWLVRASATAMVCSGVADAAIRWRRVRAAVSRAARKIVDIEQKIFGEEIHQYRAASLDDFPHLDRAFYDMARTWLLG